MAPDRLSKRVGEVLLAAVLCVGLFLMVGMLAPITTNVMAGGADLFSWRVVFDKEGMPRLELREMSYSYKQRTRQVTWYDFDFNEIGTYNEGKTRSLRLGGIVDFDAVLRSGWRGGRRADLTGWRFLPPPGAEAPIWHRLPYRGQLVGYLYPYGREIGRLGPQGLIEPGQTGARFVDPRYVVTVPKLGSIWVDGEHVYSIDLERMTVALLWTSPSGPIRALGYVKRMGIALCGDTLRVIDLDLQTQMEGPLPDDLRKNVAWQVGWLKDRLVIANVSHRHVIVYHLSPEGEILLRREVAIPLSRGMSRTRFAALTVASSIMSPWVGAGLQQFLERKFPDTYRLVQRWVDWPYRLRFLAVSLAFTLISTVLVWWHLRRRSTRFQMALGLVVTLMFSWPGYLVCRSLFEVAARVRCPSCGRRRATDRPRCHRCQAGWPSPRETGCEILLPAT